ncbi:hypothetical protein PIB30_067879 [Stylosanthes scabra]|uniref:Uncharacterized protein n=1 Tax=Stylosanthes scabra TaxID=79078 RepID=A0ABU6QNP5_9FABA|nr:hypothetical protein [Stylosanthes scabra]
MNPSPRGRVIWNRGSDQFHLSYSRSRRGKETHISGGGHRNAYIGAVVRLADGGLHAGYSGSRGGHSVDEICTAGDRNGLGGRFASGTVASVEEGRSRHDF